MSKCRQGEAFPVSGHEKNGVNAGGLPNTLSLNVCYSPKEGQILSDFFQGELATGGCRTHCPRRGGCPCRLKGFLAQEKLALSFYHLLNSWIGCTSACTLSHTHTEEIGCSGLHRGLSIWRSPGHLLGISQTNYQKNSFTTPRTQSIHSDVNTSWYGSLGLLDWICDWGFGHVYGWYGWTDQSSDRTD